MEDLNHHFRNMAIGSRGSTKSNAKSAASPRKAKLRQKTQPQAVELNTVLLNKLNMYFRLRTIPKNIVHVPVTYETLCKQSTEYSNVKAKLSSNICAEKIIKVQNPYLRLAFELWRETFYDGNEPERLFHGTKRKHIESICTYNFDWRRNGLEKGHLYGKGVNFTPSSKYALFFCDKDEGWKVMILAEVMVRSQTVGHSQLNVPPRGFDTTTREKGIVKVKYYDNDFYPTYVIYFRKTRKGVGIKV